MSVVLRASIITRKPVKWRIYWVLPSPNVMNRPGNGVRARQRASRQNRKPAHRETIIAQLPEGQFTESLVAR